MKTYEEISTIICNLNDKTFETIHEAWYEMLMESGAVRRNARKRFLYNIKKAGLTEEEYDLWEND